MTYIDQDLDLASEDWGKPSTQLVTSQSHLDRYKAPVHIDIGGSIRPVKVSSPEGTSYQVSIIRPMAWWRIITCILGMTLNLSIVSWTLNSSVVSRAWQLNYDHVCPFEHVDEVVSGGGLPAGKGVDILLSWHGLRLPLPSLFYILWHGDSANRPDYYCYFFWLSRMNSVKDLHG